MSYLVSALASVVFFLFFSFFFAAGSRGLPDDAIPHSPQDALTARVIPTVAGASRPRALASEEEKGKGWGRGGDTGRTTEGGANKKIPDTSKLNL